MPNLAGKVCLITGASRGIGRGIAIQLAVYGATCYITGRSTSTLKLVEEEAKSRGSTGKCIPVQCDHSNDEEIEKLFQLIAEKQNGKLDLLVNNAFAGVNFIFNEAKKNFWDQSLDSWDMINNVGLRGHYLCSVYASRLMVSRRQGLIVNISSAGGGRYLFMPQYGIGKAGKDRMARDCAVDLKKYNVAFVSLWPGPVKTEFIQEKLDAASSRANVTKVFSTVFAGDTETSEFSGKSIAYLLTDDDIMKKTGSIVLTSDIALEFGFNDIDGSLPYHPRSMQYLLRYSNSPLSKISTWIPSWIRLPQSVFMMLLSSGGPRSSTKDPSNYE